MFKELTDDMLKELSKCELLCSNCHREKHIDIDRLNLEKILIKKENFNELKKKIDRNKIFKLYFDDNIRIIDISKILKCSKSSISEILKEEKIKRRVNL